MDVKSIIFELDMEIARLQQARAVLVGQGAAVQKGPRKKRKISPDGRARIIAALKKRWAAAKKK